MSKRHLGEQETEETNCSDHIENNELGHVPGDQIV